MILAGFVIAVGVVVDDAIIDVENILRRLRQHRAEGSTRSSAGIVLDASLEVRGPIVYATLIIIAAAAPVFFLEGPDRLVLQAARPGVHAGGAGVPAGGPDRHPGAGAAAASPGEARPAQRRRSCGCCSAATGPCWRRSCAAPAGRTAVSRVIVAGGLAVLPGLGQTLLPDFKERDFLMHWVDGAGHLAPGDDPHQRARAAPNSSASRACATAAPTSDRR